MKSRVCLVLVTVLLAAAGAATPTAASDSVTPIDMASFAVTHPGDTDSKRLRAILRNSNRYALTTWYDTVKDYDAQDGAYLSFGGTGENQIRPPAAQAFGLAVSLNLGVYRSSQPSIAFAVARTSRLISSLAYQHRANTTGGWGGAWQSAHWAAFAGFAGWLMWDALTPTDREYVRRMVEDEANRFNSYAVPYYRDETGALLSPGDTKAEENAWNAQLLHVATAMMPKHPNYVTWMRKSIELELSATARPRDVEGTTVVNGRTLAEWLNGSNANSDGTMVNHNRLHPDYMETIALTSHAALAYSLTRTPTPQAALFNADIVYRAFVDLNFTAGAYPYADDPEVTYPVADPGGTIYQDGSANIYYPHPNDWGTQRRMQFAAMDVMADAFGFDALASKKGTYWEPWHAQQVLDMQNRHADRRTYAGEYSDAGSEDTYPGREEWVSHHAGWAYLARWIKHQGAFTVTNKPY